jgi:AmmeMemoRadiSam system protein A
MLTESEKKFLLRVARTAIEDAVTGTSSAEAERIPPACLRHSGAFVTIHKAGELRGCIGYIEPVKPMVETVREVAEKAALEDYRFQQVAAEEVSQLEIEISVMSPLESMNDPSEIQVGVHGLVIELGPARGLLLPQVATEHGWDRETFLSQTSRKAGLPMNAWKHPDAKIFIFSAEIFNEEEFRHAP